MSKYDIQLLIVDDNQVRSCGVDCGMDWSSAEALSLADQQVKARFGDIVRFKYMDLSELKTYLPDTSLHKEVTSGNMSLPLLVINGETRISGPFDMRMMMDAIEAVLETNPVYQGVSDGKIN